MTSRIGRPIVKPRFVATGDICWSCDILHVTLTCLGSIILTVHMSEQEHVGRSSSKMYTQGCVCNYDISNSLLTVFVTVTLVKLNFVLCISMHVYPWYFIWTYLQTGQTCPNVKFQGAAPSPLGHHPRPTSHIQHAPIWPCPLLYTGETLHGTD